jgi:hypothetical protein
MATDPHVVVPLGPDTAQRLDVGESDVAVAPPRHRQGAGGEQGAQSEDQRYQHDGHDLVLPIRPAPAMRPIGPAAASTINESEAWLMIRVPDSQAIVQRLFLAVNGLCGERFSTEGEIALDFGPPLG